MPTTKTAAAPLCLCPFALILGEIKVVAATPPRRTDGKTGHAAR
jgi:hypothetical protein